MPQRPMAWKADGIQRDSIVLVWEYYDAEEQEITGQSVSLRRRHLKLRKTLLLLC